MDGDSGGGTGHTSTGGTTDGAVRSSATAEGSDSNEVGATDLKALGYDVEVDEVREDSSDAGRSALKYVLYLVAVLVVLAVLLSAL